MMFTHCGRSSYAYRLVMLLLVACVAIPITVNCSFAQVTTPGFRVIKTINVDISPFGATTAPDGRTIWVANSGGLTNNSDKVTIIDIATLTEEPNKITVGRFPEDIAFGRLGLRAFVTNSTDGTVSVIDVLARRVVQTVNLAPVPLNFPFGIVTSLDDRKVFVTTQGDFGKLGVLDNDLFRVTLGTPIPLPGFSGRPAIRPILFGILGSELIVPRAPAETGPPITDVINPQTQQVIAEITLPGSTAFPQDVAITPGGKFAYVTLFDFSGGTGGVWVIDLERRTTVTVINTGDPAGFGIGITPDGRFVFATNFLQNTVSVIATSSNSIVATVPVGRQPNEVAVTLDGSKAFVTNQNDTTVSVISIPR